MCELWGRIQLELCDSIQAGCVHIVFQHCPKCINTTVANPTKMVPALAYLAKSYTVMHGSEDVMQVPYKKL